MIERPIKVRFLFDGPRAKSYIYDAYGYPEVQPNDLVEVPGRSVARVVALGHRHEWSGPLTRITGIFKVERRGHPARKMKQEFLGPEHSRFKKLELQVERHQEALELMLQFLESKMKEDDE